MLFVQFLVSLKTRDRNLLKKLTEQVIDIDPSTSYGELERSDDLKEVIGKAKNDRSVYHTRMDHLI